MAEPPLFLRVYSVSDCQCHVLLKFESFENYIDMEANV